MKQMTLLGQPDKDATDSLVAAQPPLPDHPSCLSVFQAWSLAITASNIMPAYVHSGAWVAALTRHLGSAIDEGGR